MRRAVVAAALVALQVAPAAQAASRGTTGDWSWREQGGLRVASTVSAEGARLAVLCSTADPGEESRIALSIPDAPPIERVKAVFFTDDGPRISATALGGEVRSASAIEAALFRGIVAMIRLGSVLDVVLSTGQGARFDLSGSAKAIGPDCPPGRPD